MVPQKTPSENSVRFGSFELDAETGELRKHGTRLKISGQAIRVLTVLCASAGEMVSRETLKRTLWPGSTSGDFEHGLNAAVNRLREVLGDSATDPVYVETIPGKGYRFIGKEPVDVRSQPEAETATPPPVSSKRPRLIGGTILGLGLLGILIFFLRVPIERIWRLYQRQSLRVVRLTSLPGKIASPSFSPDGSQIAFAWNGESGGAGFDLYVKVIDSSDAPHRLTNHPALRLAPAWSPDGRNIAFSRVADDDSGVFLISPSGGVERKVAQRTDRSWYGSEVSWSPDGHQITFIDRPTVDASDTALQLYTVQLDSLVKREFDTGCPVVGTPAFSHNGQYLAWVCNRQEFRSEIVVRDLRNQQLRILHRTHTMIDGIAWSLDDQRIVFSTDSDSGALREIEVGNPARAENLSLGQDATDLATHPRGVGFVYVKESTNVNIWRVDLASSPAHASQLLASSHTDRSPSISPDGKKIAFESDRSGATQVWLADADGSHAQQVTFFDDAVTGTPRWSYDGKKIAFDSRIGYHDAEIYIVDREGGPPRKLQTDIHGNTQPGWSHDGDWIYFSNGDDQGASAVWKVSAAGGHAVRLSTLGGTFPIESFDGSLVYFGRGGNVWSVHRDGTAEQEVKGIPHTIFLNDEWFPTATGIYFMQHPHHLAEIDYFDYKTKTVRSIYTSERPTPPWIGGMPVSSDGKWMLYAQEDRSSSDLMMMEGWK